MRNKFMRIAAGVEYDGRAYHGWQSQKTDRTTTTTITIPTIQAHIETAFSKVANQPIQVVCAGRTDAGVHAIGQIIHFDTTVQRPDTAWIFGTNTYLPSDIGITWVRTVPNEFHARFSAISRRYHYLIYTRSIRPSIGRHQVTWDHRIFDLERMNQAAAYLIGEHDFTSYRGINCQSKSAIRTIHDLVIRSQGNMIVLDIRANAFLQHMVRNIAGVLMAIGIGEREPVWAREVLEARDRRAGGVTAPPHGLYFVKVEYPEQFGIPTS
jgi:tRNA pseudouridine38-40 synthase